MPISCARASLQQCAPRFLTHPRHHQPAKLHLPTRHRSRRSRVLRRGCWCDVTGTRHLGCSTKRGKVSPQSLPCLLQNRLQVRQRRGAPTIPIHSPLTAYGTVRVQRSMHTMLAQVRANRVPLWHARVRVPTPSAPSPLDAHCCFVVVYQVPNLTWQGQAHRCVTQCHEFVAQNDSTHHVSLSYHDKRFRASQGTMLPLCYDRSDSCMHCEYSTFGDRARLSIAPQHGRRASQYWQRRSLVSCYASFFPSGWHS